MLHALQALLAGALPSDIRYPWGGPTCPACRTGTPPRACLTPRVCLLPSLYSSLGDAGRRCTSVLLSTTTRDAASIAAELEAVVASASARLVEAVVAAQWGREELQRLPPEVALPLLEAMQRCRANPPSGEDVCANPVHVHVHELRAWRPAVVCIPRSQYPNTQRYHAPSTYRRHATHIATGWPTAAYELVGRSDIAATLEAASAPPPHDLDSIRQPLPSPMAETGAEGADGLEGLLDTPYTLRFRSDWRLAEVLLCCFRFHSAVVGCFDRERGVYHGASTCRGGAVCIMYYMYCYVQCVSHAS